MPSIRVLGKCPDETIIDKAILGSLLGLQPTTALTGVRVCARRGDLKGGMGDIWTSTRPVNPDAVFRNAT